MSAVRVDVTPTPSDIAAAYWGDVLTLRRMLPLLLSGPVFALFMAILLPFRVQDPIAVFAGQALFFSTFFTVWMLFLFWLGLGRVVRVPGMMDRTSYELDDAGVHVRSEHQDIRTDWSYWRRAYETRSVLVLCGPLSVFHVLPKAQVGASLPSLRSLLRANLAGRVRLQPGDKP